MAQKCARLSELSRNMPLKHGLSERPENFSIITECSGAGENGNIRSIVLRENRQVAQGSGRSANKTSGRTE